ncbi:alpha/beta hydrolase [Parvularcula sp. ZS-1/3]|uniref:Alpha/beta hydrolase n=1 Tax=Parvularcula mediterranea TaxID=2732508 RepID=A0A7Y3W5K3_9PROT|nr:alpha/beta hydrolase [Parvularcula mediterranea]NNU16719.1 alpha/beta hydrolase [Parvularcula mediterranea]
MLTIDPAVFDPSSVTPETQAVNDQIEAFLKDKPTIIDLGAPLIRELRAKGEGLLGKQPESKLARWETAKANGLEVPVRVIEAEGEKKGVYLHIHGGGGCIGTADTQDQLLERLAMRLQVAVVSVEYRLAPENPWPAGPDDCEAAAVWLFENAGAMFGTEKIIIGGESAGGHLAAVTILRMRDKHDKRFLGANLVYGAFDMRVTPSMRNWGPRNLILSTPIVEWFFAQQFPEGCGYEMDDPGVSPLLAKLDDLCPALFSVGTADPLIDDTLMMAPRWLAAGNRAELEIYPGGVHAFDHVPGLKIAEEHHERAYQFLEGCLA